MTDAEEAYIGALLDALVRELVEHPVPGRLARVVIRWFENADPLYLTIHALGTDEADEIEEGDAWCPLEWPDVDREEARADRIVNDPRVQAAGPTLAAEYAELADMQDGEWRASPALIEVARRAPHALAAAGIESADYMLVLAAHFEGGGAAHVMDEVAPPPRVVAALRARDELPDE
jgi:hypothetical protein